MQSSLAMQFPATVHGYIFEKCIGRGTYSLVYDVTSLKYKQQFCAKVTEMPLPGCDFADVVKIWGEIRECRQAENACVALPIGNLCVMYVTGCRTEWLQYSDTTKSPYCGRNVHAI